MVRSTALLAMAFIPLIALAEPIPGYITSALKPFKTKSASLEKNVLNVHMSVPIVNFENYKAFYETGLCSQFYSSKDKKIGSNISMIEVRNETGAQGFAIPEPKKHCQAIGKLNNDDSKKYLYEHTMVCIAGNECRPRQPGELTSGDN